MRIERPERKERITITLTRAEKIAIAKQAEKENRTLTNFIRYALRDVLGGINDEGE